MKLNNNLQEYIPKSSIEEEEWYKEKIEQFVKDNKFIFEEEPISKYSSKQYKYPPGLIIKKNQTNDPTLNNNKE